ncbi:hypothetical protein DSECCO2_295880 [anaerobic digester metagenome]
MIAHGYSNVRAEIEFNYNILSQVIDEIPAIYKAAYKDFMRFSVEEDSFVADGDKEIYLSVLRNFEGEGYRQEYLCEKVGEVFFCSIFSYCESMLKTISQYYDITLKEKIKDSFNEIKKTFRLRYLEDLPITESDSQYVNEFSRLLRNYFIHGNLSDYNLRKLESYIFPEDGIYFYSDSYIRIVNNDFLINALKRIRSFLIDIESAFSAKVAEDFHQMNLAKEIVHQAVVNYPTEYPGLEDEFPPYCSIDAHRLLIKAEQIYLKLANKGNPEAQTLLANLYMVGIEIPDTEKGLYWLDMAVQQGYKLAITMMNEYNNVSSV